MLLDFILVINNIIMVLKLLLLWCIFYTTIPKVCCLRNYRLNEDIIPNKYNVEISMPDFPADIHYSGKVSIELSLPNNTRIIRLHKSNEMNITNIEFDGTLVSSEVKYNTSTEIMEVDLVGINVQTKNSHRLNIDFESMLYDNMYGFYISTYVNKDGDKETLGTTQFQPTHARKAFPCFDEPFFKAKFSLSIIHPDVYTATGNQPILAQRKNGRLTTTIFEETEKMSTYLVAFVVHKFTYKNASSEANKPIKIWAHEELIDNAKFAASITKNILESLENFTGISYWSTNMKKIDQFAIPDFAGGAMENWGLVTYREAMLLWDEKEARPSSKETVATLIAHELSHMWFGNLVTLNWWNTTWLNEGFARYCEYFTTHDVIPEWDLDKLFPLEQVHTVFQVDATVAASPLTFEVYTQEEIEATFGGISYSKGACVVRMMVHFLGYDKFQEGIQSYLKENRLGSVSPDELFSNLQKVDETINVADILKTWTEQSGYPIVNVKLVNNKLQFQQEPFVANVMRKEVPKFQLITKDKRHGVGNMVGFLIVDDTKHAIYNQELWYTLNAIVQSTVAEEKMYTNKLWHIPINYAKSGDAFDKTNPIFWLRNASYTHGEEITSEWVVVNVKQTGFYRVNYDEELWNRICKVLQENHEAIDEINKAQIMDDLFNFARNGILPYRVAFEISSYLKEEESYYPWFPTLEGFSFLTRLSEGELKQNITNHLRGLMEKIYSKVSFDVTGDESNVELRKQMLIIKWACEINNEDCYTQSVELLDKYIESNTEVNYNIRSIVYCSAIRHAKNERSWEYLLDELRNTTQQTANFYNLIVALGCSRDKYLLNKYLQMSISNDSGISALNSYMVYESVLAGNPEGIDVVLDFINNNSNEFIEFYKRYNLLLGIIIDTAGRIRTKNQLEKLEKFLNDNIESLGETANYIDLVLYVANFGIQWIEQNKDNLAEYFQTQ